jgi:hypothetical protein
MNKLQNRMRLFSLITIFFLYRAIASYIEKDPMTSIVWALISISYVISLIILYFVVKKWQKENPYQK